jgi:myo-inositol catabolism protein IolC
LMAEVLVPPTPAQRAAFAHDPDAWEQGRRPQLMVAAVDELRAAGADPSMWKVEGLDHPEAAKQIAESARADGRDAVSCIVLGRGESLERVEQWLRVGASVDGYVGFAVGRSLWNDEAAGLWTGLLSPADARATISSKYLRLCRAWRSAGAAGVA